MALNAYLKLDGIDGESQDKGHTGEIEILSFSWGITQSASRDSSGAGAGKVTVNDIVITKRIDVSSTKLMNACATGKHIKTAQLEVTGKARANFDFFLKLEDVLISSVRQSANNDTPMESISLNYAKIEEDYTPFNNQGQASDTVSTVVEIPEGTIAVAQ